MLIAAFILSGLGATISALNFYLSFVLYPLRRHIRKGQPFKWASGFPLIGSVLLWVAAGLSWSAGATRRAVISLIISLFDTGGIHWLFISIVYHWLTHRRAKIDA